MEKQHVKGSKTRSQQEVIYLENSDVYDTNNKKAKLIVGNMPKFGNPKIKNITESPNDLDINFLIMSHDGKDYDKRDYSEVALIRINNYIDCRNNIRDSFIEGMMNNSPLYRKHTKDSFGQVKNFDKLLHNFQQIKKYKFSDTKIILDDKELAEEINKFLDIKRKDIIELTNEVNLLRKHLAEAENIKELNEEQIIADSKKNKSKPIGDGAFMQSAEVSQVDQKLFKDNLHYLDNFTFDTELEYQIKSNTKNIPSKDLKFKFIEIIYELNKSNDKASLNEIWDKNSELGIKKVLAVLQQRKQMYDFNKILISTKIFLRLSIDDCEKTIKNDYQDVEDYLNKQYVNIQDKINDIKFSELEKILFFQNGILPILAMFKTKFFYEDSSEEIATLHQNLRFAYKQIYYLQESKNGHSEDIIQYINYHKLYQDIKKNFSEDKNFTVNTLIYSYNSICNTNEKKGCKKKLKFLQNMLKYMNDEDINNKIDNNKEALSKRNVMHVNYDIVFNEEKQLENFNKKVGIPTYQEQKSFENSSVSSHSITDFSSETPKSPTAQDLPNKIYTHTKGAITKHFSEMQKSTKS